MDYLAVCGKLGDMKSFYSSSPVVVTTKELNSGSSLPTTTRARVAVYEAPMAAPRVEEVEPVSAGEYIEALSSRVYELARSQGGVIPYTVVREVAENLIHASFAEPVVSVLDGGNTIRFADQGPGIPDKHKAVLPGFTTATGPMKQYIRGVGSGLPIVRDFLSITGGELVIEDNLGCGAVVTISGKGSRHTSAVTADQTRELAYAPPLQSETRLAADQLFPCHRPGLSNRQQQVLALVMESGSAGPSLVSRELGVGISTAYRDLASLEELGLISADGGKRALTEAGMAYLDDLIAGS